MNDAISRDPRPDRVLVAIVVLGLALRLALIVALPQAPWSDGNWYVDRAREIAMGMGYQENGHPTAFWPAGYPVLLAATMRLAGPGLAGAMALNLVAAVVTIWLVGWLGHAVTRSPAIGRTAALLYAIYPAHLVYSGVVLAEVVSTALLVGAIALLLAARGRALLLLAAGLAFGAATLMRAQFMYVPLGFIVALILLRRVSWRQAVQGGVLVHLALAATVLPLTLRNHRVLGAWVPVSTNGGVALRTGASDDATGDHLDWNADRWNREGVPFEQRVERQVEADTLFRARAREWIGQHPAHWVALMPVKVMTLWLKDSDAFWGLQLSYPNMRLPILALAGLNQLFYLAILLLSLPALLRGLKGWRRGSDDRDLLILFLVPAFVTLVAAVFTGQIRYHFPAMPFLIVAAAATLVRWRAGRMTRAARVAT